MVSPSSPHTISQRNHTEIRTGASPPASQQRSCGRETPASDAAAYFLPRGLGSEEHMLRPRDWRANCPILCSKWQGGGNH